MTDSKIGLIIGSTRDGRFADHPAEWIADHIKERGDMGLEVLDLRDYQLPFLGENRNPATEATEQDSVRRWKKKLATLDGFIATAAEYNHAPTGALKNAIDHAKSEWHQKPIAFVGYGGVGGARAVEHLRLIAIELQMAPIRNAVHIPFGTYLEVTKDGKKLKEFDFLNDSAKGMLDQFAWWVNALKTAREAG